MPRHRADDDLHDQILQLLLYKVRHDPYPSTTHLDMLESLLRDEDETEEYGAVLMDKVRLDSFPSMDHLRRLQNFA